MALLRRGSSRISEENFNGRLEREKAKTGAVAASLAWNDPSDLDLHANIHLEAGGKAEINYRNKRNAGGYLDVDMHARDTDLVDEPVENVFWKKPPAGVYSILVKLYKKRGAREGGVPFRAILKREAEEPLSVEGQVAPGSNSNSVECFRFTVDKDGGITMGKVGSPMPTVAMKAMKVMRSASGAMAKAKANAKAKAVAKAKAKAKAKVSTIAKGKGALKKVYQGQKLKTKGGLKKEDLIKSKDGKIVSAKKSKAGRESKWAKAAAKARAEKGYTGFKAIKKGTSFYDKAKEYLAQM